MNKFTELNYYNYITLDLLIISCQRINIIIYVFVKIREIINENEQPVIATLKQSVN